MNSLKTEAEEIAGQEKIVFSKREVKVGESYICICRKEYKSFPALYLHNKIKHDSILTMSWKNRMKKRTVWSGTRKISVYQFPQESQSEEYLQRIHKMEEKQLRKKNKKIWFQNMVIQSELNAFVLFMKKESKKNENLSISKIREILEQLVICFQKSFKTITKQTKIQPMLARQIYLVGLPHSFNHFILEQVPNSQLKKIPVKKVEKVLLQFSQWLYSNKYSNYLAVENLNM